MKIFNSKHNTMKKLIMLIAIAVATHATAQSQQNTPLQSYVTQLDNAGSATTYRQLAEQFNQLANSEPNNWLAWYYAAFCNAKTAWLYQDDGDKIEPFADQADQQIAKALSLLDTSKQKKELSEVYVVMSMVNRARVYINPMTYGPKYGPVASRYTQLALHANADNGRALYIAGWEKYATPKMWGGDKKKAKELFQQALQHLNSQTGEAGPHWGKKEVEAIHH